MKEKLPDQFVIDSNLLHAKLLSELAILHQLEPTPENMYAAGKLLAILGLIICATSQHKDLDTARQDIINEINLIYENTEKHKDEIDKLFSKINEYPITTSINKKEFN